MSKVILELSISLDGSPRVRTSARRRLSGAAASGLREWTFEGRSAAVRDK